LQTKQSFVPVNKASQLHDKSLIVVFEMSLAAFGTPHVYLNTNIA